MQQQVISVLDNEINKVTQSYPNFSDESLGRTVRLNCFLMGTQPCYSDFEVTTTDKHDSGKVCAGPYVFRSPQKPWCKAPSIHAFVSKQVGMNMDKPLNDRIGRDLVGEKHVHFVSWKLHDEPHFQDMRRRFHQHSPELFLSDFMVVPNRKQFDLAVCEHTVFLNTTEVSEESKMQEIQKHIHVCLRKKLSPQPIRPKDNVWIKWATGIQPVMTRANVESVWKSEHPYFSKEGCHYYPNGVLSLTEEEAKDLPDDCARQWKSYQQNQLSTQDVDFWTRKLRDKMQLLKREYERFQFDTTAFAFCHEWSFSELMKVMARPVVPRARWDVTLPFTYAMQQFATSRLAPRLQLWTNDKTYYDKQQPVPPPPAAAAAITTPSQTTAPPGTLHVNLTTRKAPSASTKGRGKKPTISSLLLTSRSSSLAEDSDYYQQQMESGGKEKKKNDKTTLGDESRDCVILLIQLDHEFMMDFLCKALPGLEFLQLDNNNKYALQIGLDKIRFSLHALAKALYVPNEALLCECSGGEPRYDPDFVSRILQCPRSVRQQQVSPPPPPVQQQQQQSLTELAIKTPLPSDDVRL